MSLAVLLASDINVAVNIAFYVVAAVMIFGALQVVSSRKIVYAALWLVVVLAGAAVLYLLGSAEFVGVSQIMVYLGAVMILFLFGIMLTQSKLEADDELNNPGWYMGIPVAVLLGGVLIYAISSAGSGTLLPDATEAELDITTTQLADAYLGPQLVPLIALSFVLLAAAVGAIVLARKD
ncbi:MAG: hypothetical protein CSA55_05680 [Ilumatobacter coccineus]|uniref:NADH-quinone oxidoreductase subunit J n=1 Tax=Ilumatobacter coccineus TaxID=467094 RepID=A0A2G6K6Y4_9ACTN|nr:MAG: hypothetical protein CSA55_05680 [Ilumatobacter coccineus]